MSDREAARDLLRELLAEALAGTNGNTPAPTVPPPPVAAVLRPSSWAAPPSATDVVGDGAAEPVVIDTDDDLQRFVRGLAARLEDPAQREAIRAGRVRFALARGGAATRGPALPGASTRGPAVPGGVIRVDRGAVTERKVAEAAKAGARLVLGPGAVLTPLAREKARALGIDFERER
jgi:hypothetical protein